jgi:hypothetical protein
MNPTDLKILEDMSPCADGSAWGKTQNSLHDVYENCERGDWMIWLLGHSKKITKTQAIEIAIVCAKHVYHDPDWNRWADAWLDGSDRAKASAEMAARAASAADWAAYWASSAAAWAAAWAESAAESAADWTACAEMAARAASAASASWEASAEMAARAASAASASWEASAEIKWQADRIREIVENPWGTK